MEGEGNSQSFLSLEQTEKNYIRELEGDAKDYPYNDLKFFLGNKKMYYEREAYTFLELLGDFGGFNDALFLIIGTLSSFYASQMYQASIA